MASASVELLANAYRKTFCMLIVLHRIFKATTMFLACGECNNGVADLIAEKLLKAINQTFHR
ncbi:hypothetical protein T12_17097 [Trichinella patagoniensis]|uniref:Uncharacterized protein n=1 Tax=Trichinella patagoniensis TaxID=990121 RepID=A0A0V0ZPT7_9BILA|nr:hypothetical protein T12_17097 [Trichinella patagoniensis]